MSTTADAGPSNACGSCGAVNEAGDKFCSGCGQSLWENCPSCNKPTPIGRNFCKECGYDLQSAVNEKTSGFASQIARAKSLMGDGKFQFAVRVLEPISQLTDFRFKDFATSASALVKTCNEKESEWQAKLNEIPAAAQSLLAKQNFKEVVALLSPIPKGMMSDELTTMLADARSNAEVAQKAKDNLKAALDCKDWAGCLFELASLRNLFPSNEKYHELTLQVAAKIAKAAQKLSKVGEYREALDTLATIPVEFQSNEVEQFRRTLEELTYLRKLVATSPLCSSAIGAAIERLKKMTPGDKRLEKLVEKYSKTRGSRPAKSFHFLPPWTEVQSGENSSSITPSFLPSTIPGARPESLSKNGGQFWTAFGLALQGLGLGQDTANLKPQTKGGFFSFGKKRTQVETAWGLDIGDQSVKLMRLKNSSGQVEIDEAFLFPIAENSAEGAPKATELYKALERAFEDSSLGETPVVCNLPSSDLLSRYMDLPSDNPSKHADFVGQEAQANIPIAYDLLSTGYYIFEKARESSVSQVAMLTALRKTDVEARESMFKQLKVNLVGMLAEPVANYNALKHLNYLGEVNPGSAEAIMMVDVGHVRTNIQFFTSFGSWFRTIDWGIESLSQALAVGLKITHKDGDGVRRNIMRSKSVSESMGFLREACTVPKREIERSVRAATEQLKELEVVESILVGGGVYQPFLGSLLNNEDL